jgi:chromosome segregation ATPase
LNLEINDLEESKKQTEKQWEDALSAMAKRDQTFQSVFDAREKLKEELLDSENSRRVLKIEKEEAEKKLREKELDCQGLEAQVQFLKSSLSTMDNRQRETRSALVEAQIAESLYKQELDKISKHQEVESFLGFSSM